MPQMHPRACRPPATLPTLELTPGAPANPHFTCSTGPATKTSDIHQTQGYGRLTDRNKRVEFLGQLISFINKRLLENWLSLQTLVSLLNHGPHRPVSRTPSLEASANSSPSHKPWSNLSVWPSDPWSNAAPPASLSLTWASPGSPRGHFTSRHQQLASPIHSF